MTIEDLQNMTVEELHTEQQQVWEKLEYLRLEQANLIEQLNSLQKMELEATRRELSLQFGGRYNG